MPDTWLRFPCAKKPYADGTLRNMTKAELIQIIRDYEHNYAALYEANERGIAFAEKKFKALDATKLLKRYTYRDIEGHPHFKSITEIGWFSPLPVWPCWKTSWKKQGGKTMTLYEKIQTKSPEELAELFAAHEIALTDFIFKQVERTLLDKRGIKIDFTKHYKPDLLSIKKEFLDWLNTEASDAEE